MKNLILFVGIVTLLFSCKKDEKTYQDATLAEFSKSEISQTISFTDTSDITIPIKIQLNSKAYSVDKILEITEIGQHSAIKDKHYIVADYKTIIHADSLYAVFNLIVKSVHFSEGETVSVSFKIAETSEIKPSSNYNKCTVTLTKQSFLNLFVGSYTCLEPINQDSYIVTFVAGSDPKTIKNTNFWNFPAKDQTVTYTISKDASMSVEINKQNWIDKTGKEYQISGKGTYDLTGKMIVNYIVMLDDSIYEEGVHTFIPIR